MMAVDTFFISMFALTVTASLISALSSSIIIAMIFKSREGLSTIFHRLMLAISICDLISSLSMSVASIPCPTESGLLLASGSVATCDVQGFFNMFTLITPLYNSALCIHFLLAIKYEVSDARRKFIDPFLLGIPALWGIFCSFYFLATNAFNAGPAGVCWVFESPIGCGNKGSGVECIRGSGAHDSLVYKTYLFLVFVVVPIIVFSSLFAIYKSVSKRETRSSSYGAASLNITSRIPRSGRRQNNRLTLSRKSLHKLLAFSGAWFFTNILFIIVACTKRFANVIAPRSIYLAMTFLYPLQGHFNFLIYVYPTVLNIKRSRNNYSWYEAFMRAVKSKLNLSLSDERRRRDLRFSLANTRQFEVCEPTDLATSSNQNTVP